MRAKARRAVRLESERVRAAAGEHALDCPCRQCVPTEPHPNDCDCIDCINDDVRASGEETDEFDSR